VIQKRTKLCKLTAAIVLKKPCLRDRKQGFFTLSYPYHLTYDLLPFNVGSHIANNVVALLHVRDNLGHESISTTNRYLHSSDDSRHQETEGKHKIDW